MSNAARDSQTKSAHLKVYAFEVARINAATLALKLRLLGGVASIRKVAVSELPTCIAQIEQALAEGADEVKINIGSGSYVISPELLNELKNAYNYLKILDKVIDAIDTKDNNYITATKTKIEYKSLDYHDLRDQINKVIDLINNTQMKEFILDDKLIDLSNLDEESVRKPSRINEKLDEVIVNVNTLSLEEEKILRNELLKEFKNDFNKIKKKLDEVKDTIFDTNALLKNYNFSIYDIFMIYLHSSDLDFNYEIILKDESLIFNNYKFKNYELRRK